MAEVFRAKTFGAAGFERTVAIKLLLPNVAMDSEFVTMLIDEAKIAGQLSHANIAQIFDLGQAEGRYYIVQEYIHGRDLRAILKALTRTGRRLSVGQAVHIILKVCEGLEYAHNKRDHTGLPLNLVHRDISPQNVVVSLEGEVKLIDFGIAKAEGRATRTLAGLVKGKFAYMSPEQIRGLPVDRRSDVFATGIVLHELLTGKPLFRRKSEFETLKRARSGVIDPPGLLNPDVPAELDTIVLGALARHVEDRYQSAVELRDALWQFSRTSGHFYSRNELAAWMVREFGDGPEEPSEPQMALEDFPSIEIESAADERKTIVDLDDEERDSAERSGELRSPNSEMSDVGVADQLDGPSVEIAPEVAVPRSSRLSQGMTAQMSAAEMAELPETRRPAQQRKTMLAASAPAPTAGPRPAGAPVSHHRMPAQGQTGQATPASAPPPMMRPGSQPGAPAAPERFPASSIREAPLSQAPASSNPQIPHHAGPPGYGNRLAPPAPIPAQTGPNPSYAPIPPPPVDARRSWWPLLVAIAILAASGAATVVLIATGQ
jgi:serine/threonine protein kinase